MASVTGLYESPYLKAEDIGSTRVTGTITEIGPEPFRQPGKGDQLKLVMRTDAHRKLIVVNKTNATILLCAFGDDWQLWAGRRVEIYTEPRLVNGSIKPGLALRPVTEPQNPPAAAAEGGAK